MWRIETSNLLIRRIQTHDASVYQEFYTNKKYWEFELSPNLSLADVDAQLFQTIDNAKSLPENIVEGEFAIVLKTESKVIGLITTIFTDNNYSIMELGISLLVDYQGKNYAHEALTRFVQYALEQNSTHRIACSTNSKNIRCINLLEKVGFIKEGELRKALLLQDGSYGNISVFSIVQP